MAFYRTKQERIENDARLITDYTTEELKAMLGDWEREREEAIRAKPEKSEQTPLGVRPQGLIDLAVAAGAIVCRNGHWFVRMPEIDEWQKKESALAELKWRREFAAKKEREAQDAIADQEVRPELDKSQIGKPMPEIGPEPEREEPQF